MFPTSMNLSKNGRPHTPLEINLSHLGKRKIIYALSGGYVNSLEGIQNTTHVQYSVIQCFLSIDAHNHMPLSLSNT